MLGIVPIGSLAELSASQRHSYGPKIVGYGELLSLQRLCPLAFHVPAGWGISSKFNGHLEADLQEIFKALVKRRRSSGALMARGSSPFESPGRSPTKIVAFDPKDRDGSFQRFKRAVNRVLDSEQGMSVLASPLVGRFKRFADGTPTFGWDNVSFVANTYNPANPKEIFIAVVNGLGTRAVEGNEAIFVTANREHGLITGFLHKTEKILRTPRMVGTRLPCKEFVMYRQRKADFFNLRTGKRGSGPLGHGQTPYERGYFTDDLDIFPWVDHGVFGAPNEPIPDSAKLAFLNLFGSSEAFDVGMNPFVTTVAMLSNLIGILQFLATERGSVQIEGCFDGPGKVVPYLYQLLKMPKPAVEARRLRVKRPHLTSSCVVGVGEFRGPLVTKSSPDYMDKDYLRKLDRRFSETGYILLAKNHPGALVAQTPHARRRLSTGDENLVSHAWTLTQLKNQEDPQSGYILGTRVTGSSGGSAFALGLRDNESRRENWECGGVSVYNRVHLDSNGQELAVQIFSHP